MAAEASEADRALVAALESAGFSVPDGDVWLLKPTDPESIAEAFPILVDHLERGGLSDMAVAASGALLSQVLARPFFGRIVGIYESRSSGWPRESLAGAVAVTAGRRNLPELERLFRENEGDVSSIMFVRKLLRLDREKWRSYFQEHAAGAVWAVEAEAALKGRSPNS